jgi:hypothetical protein
MRQLQHVTVLGRFRENVALASDIADKRHHNLFANRVNGRIRNLREELLEIVKQRLRPVGKTSQWRIRAHGADRLLALQCHGTEDHAEILIAIAKRTLPSEQRFRIWVVHARGFRQLIDRDLIVFEPLRIRLSRSQPVFDFLVRNNAAFDRVY